jgi:hypothetical protein
LITNPLFALQDAGTTPTPLESCTENLNSLVNRKLNYWDTAIGLNGDNHQTIQSAMNSSVKTAAMAMTKEGEPGYLKQLPQEVLQQLEQKLVEVTGPEMLESVRDDELIIKNFHRRAAIDSVLARMDLGLALSEVQIEKLRTCLTEDWSSEGYKVSSPAYSRSLPRGDFPDNSIANILTPNQMEYWIANRQQATAGEEITFHYAADDASRLENFSPKLDEAIELRVSVIRQQFELDDPQVRKLELLARRYRKKLIDLRQQSYDDVQMVRDMGRPPTDSPLIGHATMTASALLGSEGGWTDLVRKTLRDKDQTSYKKLSSIRQQLHQSANTYHLVRVYECWASLSGQQMVDLYPALL